MTTATATTDIGTTTEQPSRLDTFFPDINKDLGDDLRYEKVDRFIVIVLWFHFAVLAAITFSNSILNASERYPSPFSLRPVSNSEALIATLIGLVAVVIPTLLRNKISNHYIYRLIVTASLITFSYLYVLESGGSIEMHFHFFMVMALLVVYADWRLEWMVLVMTALHHVVLNYTHAEWVYSYGRNDISVVAHALPVLAEAVFTSMLCMNHRKAVLDLHESHEALTAQNDLLRDARSQAATDGLTDLQNHRSFQQHIRAAVSQMEEKERLISLIMVDLDNFKPINDTCGHVVGDEVLRDVARSLEQVAGKSNVYRYGGDEFAVILVGVDHTSAVAIAGRIRETVQRNLSHRTEDVAHATASLGVACYPTTVQTVEELIYGADAAMYWAKSEGKNRVGTWSDIMKTDASTGYAPSPRTDGQSPSVQAADTLNALVAALRARDKPAGSASGRCSFYAVKVGEELGLDERELKIVELSALMHDVGKLAITDQVLLKPGPLNDEEWNQMRQHPVIGRQIVSGVLSTNDVSRAVLHHHEHYDGSGYPSGLSGDAIPVAARILLVIDAFDAMTNDRPYRETQSVAETLSEIKSKRGTQFDPEAVDAFLRVLDRHGEPALIAEAEATSHFGVPIAPAGEDEPTDDEAHQPPATRRSA